MFPFDRFSRFDLTALSIAFFLSYLIPLATTSSILWLRRRDFVLACGSTLLSPCAERAVIGAGIGYLLAGPVTMAVLGMPFSEFMRGLSLILAGTACASALMAALAVTHTARRQALRTAFA